VRSSMAASQQESSGGRPPGRHPAMLIPIARIGNAVKGGAGRVGSGILHGAARITTEAITAPVLATVKVAESATLALVSIGGTGAVTAVGITGKVVGTVAPVVIAGLIGKRVIGGFVRHLLMKHLKEDCGAYVKTVGRNVDWDEVSKEVATRYPVGHSHAFEAGVRYEADVIITRIADDLGLPRWDSSICRRTANTVAATGFKITGQRHCYTAADLAAEYRNDTIPKNALISIVDQDWYLGPSGLDIYEGHPIAIYTIFGEGVAGRRPGSNWAMLPDNRMVYMWMAVASIFMH